MSTPYSPAEAVEFIDTLLTYDHVVVLPISPDVATRLTSLLRAIEVRGPHVFDLQIAATMLVHGVNKLFTYNGTDFKDVVEIQTAEPEASPSTAL